MIRVELGKEVKPGVWAYKIDQLGVEGRSRQPLLDACRAVQRMGGDTARQQIGLYWPGKDQPSLVCTVGWGAAKTVNEDGPRFAKWNPHPMAGEHPLVPRPIAHKDNIDTGLS